MRVISTEDIPTTLLDTFAQELEPTLHLEIDHQQYCFRSAAPPSWIALLEDPSWWLKAFGACVALYIAEIVREAGKSTWKNRSVVGAALRSAGRSAIRVFARALWRLRIKVSPRTGFAVGLPSADFGTRLALDLADEQLLEIQLALFVHHLPKLAELIRSESLDTKAFGSINLRLQDDGSLEATWIDSDTEQERRHVFRLDSA